MIPAEDNFADVSLKVPGANGVEYSLFGPFKYGVERLRRVVVGIAVHKLLGTMVITLLGEYATSNHMTCYVTSACFLVIGTNFFLDLKLVIWYLFA